MSTPKKKKKNSSKQGGNKFSFFSVFTLTILSITTCMLFALTYFITKDDGSVFNETDDKSQPDTSLVSSKETGNDKSPEKKNGEKILENITINQIDVGGLSKEEAMEVLLKDVNEKLENRKITFNFENNNYDLPLSKVDLSYNLSTAIDEAYNLGHEADKDIREKSIDSLKNTKHDFKIDFVYDNALINGFIDTFAHEIETEPVNATMERSGGKFVFTDEAMGKKINRDTINEEVNQRIKDNSEEPITVVLEDIQPKYTVAQLSSSTKLLGTYKTLFKGSTADRSQNIKNAASKVNNTLLYPGDVFSTNASFGVMTLDNGYRPGSTIVNGKLEDSIGGGVCQVSSTLYMATLFSELEVIERRNHSMKVGYVDWAFDATLAGDYIDLKIKNSTEFPVLFETIAENNEMVVNIYGNDDHDPGRRLVFESVLASTTPPPAEKVVEDPSLPLGERVVVTKARTGYSYNLYKTVYENDKVVDKVIVNTSTYKAVGGEVKVGTGPAVVEPPADQSITQPPTEQATTETPPATPQQPAVETPSVTPPATEQVTEPATVEESQPVVNTSPDGFVVPEE